MRRWGEQKLRHDRENVEIDPYSQAGRDLALRGEAVIRQYHNVELPPEPYVMLGQARQRTAQIATHRLERREIK